MTLWQETDLDFGLKWAESSRRRAPLYRLFGKRLFDVVVAASVLAVMSPVLVTLALLLRLKIGPGIVYRQQRVGLHGHDFTMLKFRTMLHSRRADRADQRAAAGYHGVERRQTHKSVHDPRHTRIGALLRKTSLDELPQLLNVIRGEMTLVGPRPELSTVIDDRQLRAHPRHTVKPGITGLWQTGRRNEGTLLHECFDDDLEYLDRLSLAEDVRILAATVRVLAKPSGR